MMVTIDDVDEDAPKRAIARYRGQCAECGRSIEPGDAIVWAPSRGPERSKTYCVECGEEMLEA
jgi:hypothetical protein